MTYKAEFKSTGDPGRPKNTQLREFTKAIDLQAVVNIRIAEYLGRSYQKQFGHNDMVQA